MDTHTQVTTEMVFDYMQEESDELTPIDAVMQQFDITLYEARRLVKVLLSDGHIESTRGTALTGQAIRGYRPVQANAALKRCVGY